MCGENDQERRANFAVTGSSPRVRGKHWGADGQSHDSGLIPACAGKTRNGNTFRPARRAHPRVCGENADTNERIATHKGSSPRVRGKPLLLLFGSGHGRLIPACAGKTPSSISSRTSIGAHPRVCGENNSGMVWTFSSSGSSPRVRGKPCPFPAACECGGLIPACAGKTAVGSAPWQTMGAHPRVCGENLASGEAWPLGVGSSPRVRGKPNPDQLNTPTGGLIPACAGKTMARAAGHHERPAHPRVCGENAHVLEEPAEVVGSSPRVRGKRETLALTR